MSRRLLVGGSVPVACLAVLASTAFACTKFAGTMTVLNTTTGGAVTVTGADSSASDHVYCSVPGHPASAMKVGTGDTIQVTVGPAAGCVSSTNKLNCSSGSPGCPGGVTNEVILKNPASTADNPFSWDGVKWSVNAGKGCFQSTGGNVTLSSNFAVSAAGSGQGSFTIPTLNRIDTAPAGSSGSTSGLCVGEIGKGLFVPLQVTKII